MKPGTVQTAPLPTFCPHLYEISVIEGTPTSFKNRVIPVLLSVLLVPIEGVLEFESLQGHLKLCQEYFIDMKRFCGMSPIMKSV